MERVSERVQRALEREEGVRRQKQQTLKYELATGTDGNLSGITITITIVYSFQPQHDINYILLAYIARVALIVDARTQTKQ
jgi:hypothetical protein